LANSDAGATNRLGPRRWASSNAST
jgi:hypothetical protein